MKVIASDNKQKIVLQWLQIAAGLLVFSFGVHLTIFANIGLSPWDCLAMGISYHTPLNYGLSMTLSSVIVVLIDLALRERIGYGTIIDALITGNYTQMFNNLNPFPLNQNLWIGIVIMLTGFVFMALGMRVYMSAAQCCGPRDSLFVGLGKRLRKFPIGAVQIMVLATALLIGWLLGGPVGIGTIVSTFGSGIVMQIIFDMIGFEPRKVEHIGIPEAVRILKRD